MSEQLPGQHADVHELSYVRPLGEGLAAWLAFAASQIGALLANEPAPPAQTGAPAAQVGHMEPVPSQPE